VLGRNTGGAGGFAAGLDRAVSRHDPDLVWLLDDDTVPEPDALAVLLSARAAYGSPAPGLVASRAVWTDGRDHPMNTPRRRPWLRLAERVAAERVGCVAIRSASFVSALVDADLVRARGLPLADYFLWNDDFEFSTRLLRDRPGLYCPDSVVVHKTRTFGSTDVDPGERFYYEVRNKVWMFTRSRSLSIPEKVLYGGSTLRRWARTYAASRDRATLRAALGRGLRDGVRRGPRPTAAVLAEAGLAP
jgi:GT2 family glycosyltransferase